MKKNLKKKTKQFKRCIKENITSSDANSPPAPTGYLVFSTSFKPPLWCTEHTAPQTASIGRKKKPLVKCFPADFPRDHEILRRASLAEKAAAPGLKEEQGAEPQAEEESHIPPFSPPKPQL